jgi:hypothetical protein
MLQIVNTIVNVPDVRVVPASLAQQSHQHVHPAHKASMHLSVASAALRGIRCGSQQRSLPASAGQRRRRRRDRSAPASAGVLA